MKTGTGTWMAAMLAVAAVTTCALAADPTLKVGDPAPKLQTGKWVQGDPVKDLKKGRASIVEFWATWCGPCRDSIPHLNETAKRYKDKGLVVIGQDCYERDETLVAPFIKKMGEKMTYRVALDDKQGSKNGKMAETWMEAAGMNSIPTAFLVDAKGIIAWIGHPMQLKEKVIEEVLEGKFDLAKAAADYEKEKRNEAELGGVWTALNRAMQKKDWDAATAKLDEAAKLMSEDDRPQLDMKRFSVLLGQKKYQEAYKLAAALSDAHKDSTMLQNQIAWQIATDEGIEQRDLKLAEKIATRANEAAKSGDPAILDTLARVLFMQGKKEEAIPLQEKAVKLAEGSMKKELEKSLESYKKGELPKDE